MQRTVHFTGIRTKVLLVWMLLLHCGVFAQDLSPWTTSFVVSAGGYSDTIWIGCDTAGDFGYQEGLDILDTSAFSGPLKIIGYDSVVQEMFNTTTCGNLKKDIKEFKYKRIKLGDPYNGYFKNAFWQFFHFYALIDTSQIPLDTNEYGDVDSLILSWDSTDYIFKNDDFEISYALLTQSNARYRQGWGKGEIISEYIYGHFSSSSDPKLYKAEMFLYPQEYLSECYAEYNQYDLISELWVYMEFNYFDTTTFIQGLGQENQTIGFLYPNPSQGVFNIHFSDLQAKQVKICDMMGREAYRNVVYGKQDLRLDLSGEKSGLYFIQILNDKNELIGIKKIIIQK